MKARLKYYLYVVADSGVDKKLFFFSHSGKKKSDLELLDNLRSLINFHHECLKQAREEMNVQPVIGKADRQAAVKI